MLFARDVPRHHDSAHGQFTSARCAWVQAEWCRFKGSEDPALCLLHDGGLICYEMGGQIESVAVPSTVQTIHPLPQGLLLLVGSPPNDTAYIA